MLCTLVFEGTEKKVDEQRKETKAIALRHKGIFAGAKNGKRGFMMTFVIAYIRDFVLKYNIMGESFETAVPWSKLKRLVVNVKKRINDEVLKRGAELKPFVSFRITQLYETGAAVYVYFGFNMRGIKNPLESYVEIEMAARDEVMKNGGSVSHHHGKFTYKSSSYIKELEKSEDPS